jgi:hypothetical protein
MRIAVAMILVWFVHTGYAQSGNPFQAGARAGDLTVLKAETEIFTAHAIPKLPLPQFDDPLVQEQRQRFDELQLKFFQGLMANQDPSLPNPTGVKFMELFENYSLSAAKAQRGLQDHNQTADPFILDFLRKAESEYGTNDSRYIAALEDAALWLKISNPSAAATYVEKAIQLREVARDRSVAYWKDLQSRCDLASMQPTTRGLFY